MTNSGSPPTPLESIGRTPLLSVSRLSVSIAGRPTEIVTDVSLQVGLGEIMGLVGESGSGKTTVALALLGYARPGTEITDGTVIVDGRDVLALSKPELRALRGRFVSYVPQDPSACLNPALRIGKQLREALTEHAIPAADDCSGRVRESLAEVDLPQNVEFLQRYPHELSGGQQQRLTIAMAFACRPQLVVLDEPTTGLDVTTQATVLRTIGELSRVHRTTAVYVSHDLAVVAGLADEITVMYGGEVVETGPAGQVIGAGLHPYTRGLVRASPDPRHRRPLRGIPGRVAPVGDRGGGCVFAARCEFAEAECRSDPVTLSAAADGRVVRCRRWRTVAAVRGNGVDSSLGQPGGRELEDKPYVSLQQVAAWYGDTRVLSEVSLNIRRGECLALVGESGSGKTTLARCISGHHAAASGALMLGGEAIPWGHRRRSSGVLKDIQYIFQNPYGSLNPRKNIRELIEQPLVQFGDVIDDQTVPRLLTEVGLPTTYARRMPAQLSGGERQRVAIARALALSPQLLICDEVTSALDVSVQAAVLSLLARLHASAALTVLFVTHNLAVVRAVADRVVVMQTGTIVETGTVEEVLDHPQAPYTRQLIDDTPAIEPR